MSDGGGETRCSELGRRVVRGCGWAFGAVAVAALVAPIWPRTESMFFCCPTLDLRSCPAPPLGWTRNADGSWGHTEFVHIWEGDLARNVRKSIGE
jgi:hypothetical protein